MRRLTEISAITCNQCSQQMHIKRENISPDNFLFYCSKCGNSQKISLKDLIIKEIPLLLDVDSHKLEQAYKKGNLKFYQNRFITALQFRKSVAKIEAGTMVCFSNEIHIIRGFPKIRRTLMLEKAMELHFQREVAVEEKMNGYNVRIAFINPEIVAFTRGGYVCPYTTRKASEIMDLSKFFYDYPDLVICGEMLGTDNPYVSHYYPEIGKLGFRIFDIREKVTGKPLSIKKKNYLLEKYNLPPVRLFGLYSLPEAPTKILELVKNLGENGREGVVMKDPLMKIPPLKYTSSQAHADELVYAFKFPFDLGKSFFFSRVVREGFQSYEMQESKDEMKKRAQRLGESILYPMVETIKHISADEVAGEDLVMEADNREEAEEFLHHLQELGVVAVLLKYENGRAVIRRIHQSTTDKIKNFLNGGLY
ncbi:MAG: RNA ligase [Methanobacterium sp.]|nr:RNA ligase [Methanobacterium sp.]